MEPTPVVSKCPVCNCDLNDERGPEPGDFAVCCNIGCASLLRYNDNLTLRVATPDDYDILLPEDRAELVKLQRKIDP